MVSPAGAADLLRVIDLDPHAVGGRRAHWTSGRLAGDLAPVSGSAVDPETGRL
jgi:hypothetical protein